ncbi:HNH endonuclease [Dolichospermum flos-aquae]|uniref:HNH endonuclease n=1 Tax=Nostocales TaxID=1161 RepID=UPI002D7F31EB|nr:HNH endonuclease [Dolichospermum flos-aquae]
MYRKNPFTRLGETATIFYYRFNLVKNNNSIRVSILKILISKLTQLHLHHKKSKAQGGGDNYGNLILVYLYYH